MSAALHRLARVRETLQRQAQQALRGAQERVDSTRAAIDNLRHELVNRSASGQVSASTLQLVDAAARSTLEQLRVAEEERDQCARETERRTLELRQVEKLLERVAERERRAENQAEQQASDEWASSQWGRR
jgi:hypothetical protein